MSASPSAAPGRIGLLPLGLVLLPGALLAMAGRWVVRAGAVTRLRHVGYAAIALAFPYALLAGALAVASGTSVAAPSLLQAVIAAFLLALVAGGLGAARGLAPWSRLASLMPARPRSIVMGMLGSAALLAAAGAVLARASLAVHLPEVKAASDALAPGVGGARCCCSLSSPTSRTRSSGPSPIPSAPASPSAPERWSPRPGWPSAPYRSSRCSRPCHGHRVGRCPARRPRLGTHRGAGPAVPGRDFAGVVTVRITPTPVIEAAALWGFAAGTATGLLAGLAAAFAGGPLGSGRLASVGPSGFQVGLVAILELGITAALSAAAANWLILRRAPSPGLREATPRPRPAATPRPAPTAGPAGRDR